MRNVVLFIGISLDGFIAGCDGNVDWMSGQGEEDVFDSYGEFVQNVDAVVMGWNTYHQIVTELSPEEWVYRGMDSYVITHRKMKTDPDAGIYFINENVCDLGTGNTPFSGNEMRENAAACEDAAV